MPNLPSPVRPYRCLQVLGLSVLTLCLVGCNDKPSSKPKQMAQVKILPDTPPPPPPPKQEEKKPEPKPEDKAQAQPQPKSDPTPEPPVLKTDETPSDSGGSGGPVAGAVTEDYKSGVIGGGSGGTAVVADRLAATGYANATSRALNEYLNRDQDVKRRGDYLIEVNVWLDGNGKLKRSQLTRSSGDPETDQVLKDAISRFPGLKNPPPENMPQPIKLKVTNRMIG